jgi:voltage-gated potassium channel
LKRVEQRITETRRFQRRLFTARAVAPGVRLLHRFFWALGLFLAVLAVLWLDRDGLRDAYDGSISFIDLVYFTFVTITTVGYGDIVPVTERARLIDAVFVTPARLAFIMIFVGTAYELVIQRWVEGFRMARLQGQLKDHIVICGFGAVGQLAARELLARGTPPTQLVVLDRNDSALEAAADLGVTGLRGDASRADVLDDAAVGRARGVIVCAGGDAVNALISLAVRRHSQARLIVAAEGLDTTDALRQSGAEAVISPPALGGYLLADAVESPPVAAMLVDLLTAHGEVEWRELDVADDQIGRPPPQLPTCVLIAIRRGHRLLWPWEAAARTLERGDHLIVMRASVPA